MLETQTLREAFKRKRYGAGEYDPDFDLLDAAADEIERLRAALERQCDNMAFILNHADVGSWHDKFVAELAEDRQIKAIDQQSTENK